jgi:site-specific recombinase XerD
MKTATHAGNTLGTKLPPEPLERGEIYALMAACSNRAPTGIRNRALLAVLWRGMLRINEALTLKPADFNADTATIRILKGKGRKARTVALNTEGAALVARWLERRAKLGINGHHPLFCTLDGGPLQTGYIRNWLPRLARRAGIEKRVHAHGLRHSGACEMRRAGVDIGIISKALGHASIATTARYLDHIEPTAVISAMRAME